MAKVTATVRVDSGAVQALLTDPRAGVRPFMERTATAIQNNAKRNLTTGPTRAVDSGTLRNSIGHRVTVERGRIVARIGTDDPKALFVHEGTGIYGPRGRPITPKRGKFLKFQPKRLRGTGTFVFAKQVKGIKPRPFLVKALDDYKPTLRTLGR